MRFTDVVSPKGPVGPIGTLQFFEAKISFEEASGLMWPLRVYGFIAARDLLDYKRNIIFERERDNCQIISEGVRVFCPLAPCLYLHDCLWFGLQLSLTY